MGNRVDRVLCAADPRGSSEAIEHLLETAANANVQAIALVGDLNGGRAGAEGYRTVFKALGKRDHPTYFVPGPADAPIEEYLKEAHNLETVFPHLHGVHGTAAFCGSALFAGMGGEISDDPGAHRDEIEALRYPRWEAEYRLKLLRELDEHQLVALFSTHPAHKGLGTPGSEEVAQLVNTFRPRLVVAAGARGTEMLGRSLVVAPGRLSDGHYAVADIQAQEAELSELGATATSRT
jgi:Icc-related predicted phosphoesterase